MPASNWRRDSCGALALAFESEKRRDRPCSRKVHTLHINLTLNADMSDMLRHDNKQRLLWYATAS